jgi:hypothetical protein
VGHDVCDNSVDAGDIVGILAILDGDIVGQTLG